MDVERIQHDGCSTSSCLPHLTRVSRGLGKVCQWMRADGSTEIWLPFLLFQTQPDDENSWFSPHGYTSGLQIWAWRFSIGCWDVVPWLYIPWKNLKPHREIQARPEPGTLL